MKAIEPERISTSTTEIEENDHMMICENSNSKEIVTTNKSPAMVIPKHCNGICKYVIERKEEKKFNVCI
jgi:hypothetical protein